MNSLTTTNILEQYQNYSCPEFILEKINARHHKFCLFLDIDGTLAEFNNNPDQVFISDTIKENLQSLIQHHITVAIVTGRNVRSALDIVQPLQVAIAGLHGLEYFIPSQQYINPKTHPEFKHIKNRILSEIKKFDGLR
ncbi:MAG: HAD-IIB family hydrolase, partial [Acinetobacter sp.]